MTTRLTRKQAAILGAYTGSILGPFPDIAQYVNTLKGCEDIVPIDHPNVKAKIKEASKADALAICATLEDKVDEPTQPTENRADTQTIRRFNKLLEGLHERFPAVIIEDPRQPVEAEYLEAIDSLQNAQSKPEVQHVQAEQFVGAASQEALFLQAVNSLRPPDGQNDPHRNRVRKVLDSVLAAYEKLKQGEHNG